MDLIKDSIETRIKVQTTDTLTLYKVDGIIVGRPGIECYSDLGYLIYLFQFRPNSVERVLKEIDTGRSDALIKVYDERVFYTLMEDETEVIAEFKRLTKACQDVYMARFFALEIQKSPAYPGSVT